MLARRGPTTVARAYQPRRAILQTAVDDERILRNPCRLAGAATPKSPERPALSLVEIAALAGAVPHPYRAYVLLASFSGLRAGELAALRVKDLELGRHPRVRVRRRFNYATAAAPAAKTGSGSPKTPA